MNISTMADYATFEDEELSIRNAWIERSAFLIPFEVTNPTYVGAIEWDAEGMASTHTYGVDLVSDLTDDVVQPYVQMDGLPADPSGRVKVVTVFAIRYQGIFQFPHHGRYCLRLYADGQVVHSSTILIYDPTENAAPAI